MSAETHRTLVTAFYEKVWNRWDADEARRILHPEIGFRGSVGTNTKGHNGFQDYAQMIREAFPDFHNQVETLVTDANGAAARLIYTGTHRGPILGFPPSGNRIAYSGAAFFVFEDGLIRRVWVLGDTEALKAQLAGS